MGICRGIMPVVVTGLMMSPFCLLGRGEVHQKFAFARHFCVSEDVASCVCLACTNSHAIAVLAPCKIAIAMGIYVLKIQYSN